MVWTTGHCIFLLSLSIKYEYLALEASRGIIGTLSRHTICRKRGLTLVPLTLARLPLFHRRLDGVTVTRRLHDAARPMGPMRIGANSPRITAVQSSEVPPSKLHSKCDCIGMAAGGHPGSCWGSYRIERAMFYDRYSVE